MLQCHGVKAMHASFLSQWCWEKKARGKFIIKFMQKHFKRLVSFPKCERDTVEERATCSEQTKANSFFFLFF